VEDAARVAGRLWAGMPARIEPLSGGITNRNFKVSVGPDVFVLRIGGRDTHLLGIDRRMEHEASRMAAAVGVGPEVVARVEPEGWLVTRFLQGRPLEVEDLRSPDMVARVARALLRVHSAPPIPGRFDSHRVVEDYRRRAAERGVDIPAEYPWALEISRRIRAARGPQPTVPCHNDLLIANFIDDGEIRIVDWEYGGMGDRFFDLGNLAVNHELGRAEVETFLRAYFGTVRPADLANLRLMRFMSDFREAMWGVVQQGISDLDFDFRAYATDHFARLKRTAAEPEFEADLAACSAW
jgi:thiamine kinase-like enzyme